MISEPVSSPQGIGQGQVPFTHRQHGRAQGDGQGRFVALRASVEDSSDRGSISRGAQPEPGVDRAADRSLLASRRRTLLSLPTVAAASPLAAFVPEAAPAAAPPPAVVTAASHEEAAAVSTGAAVRCRPVGIQALRDPALNQGLATTPEVRGCVLLLAS
jgi:hypothetical protein